MRKRILKSIPVFIIPTMIFVVLMFVFSVNPVSANGGSHDDMARFERVLVKSGDTVSSLTSEYASELSHLPEKEYMQEVISLNNLSERRLAAGDYILLPVYE